MPNNRISVRPSKYMSALGALVGLGLLGTVVLLFINPVLAAIAFVALWVLVMLGIVGYHLTNLFTDKGVAVADVDVAVDDR